MINHARYFVLVHDQKPISIIGEIVGQIKHNNIIFTMADVSVKLSNLFLRNGLKK